jgi:hypothetical protein
VHSTIEEGGYDLQNALLPERRWSMEANYLVSWASMVTKITVLTQHTSSQYTNLCSPEKDTHNTLDRAQYHQPLGQCHSLLQVLHPFELLKIMREP